MRLILVVLLFSVLIGDVLAQAPSTLPPNIRASTTLQNLSVGGQLANREVLYGLPQPEGKIIGDAYWVIDWRVSTLQLYEGDRMLEGFPIRYDIQLDEIEIKGKGGVKVLGGDKVKSFICVDSLTKKPSYFLNAIELKLEDNIPRQGFFEVLADGKQPLYKRTEISVKKANYNVQFDVGSRDDLILKKYVFYTPQGDHIVEIPTAKKKFLQLFGGDAPMVHKFMKINMLSANNEYHLTKIFEYYNGQVN